MSLRVLVTGAAGCIGRSLCRALLKQGHQVGAVVRSSASVDRLPVGVRLSWVGEIAPETTWPGELFAQADVVVHLAAKVHCRHSRNASSEFQRANSEASETLARAMAAAPKSPRLVYCSSAHAVCNFSDQVVDESSPCRPQTYYGKSKFDAEQRLRRVSEDTGLKVVILRPAPVYGPELPGDLMRLLKFASRGWPLPLGGIENRRSLVYIENVVDALIAASSHPAAVGETFFVSDGTDVSLASLLRMFAAALGRSPRLISVAPQRLRSILGLLGKAAAADRMLGSLAIDSRRIGRTLAWQPPYDLTSGLSATAQWMKRIA
ncbi:MAG: NAD-dependent epimerase/dehydratase family protein [Planctomycetia bacterium]|nr:NAD-dependent epimerase/dehydratase family protein [Planctomycetia bacterium]